tara:strand:- start:658 stop:1473 length:816 start_codon:yes stop_codon:yes gene_type:complete
MEIIKHTAHLKNCLHKFKNICFVPTMGAFHKGHISLIKAAKKKGGKLVVSIFVNPKQFNSKKDYIKYPRNIKKDLKILKKLKVDFVFLPNKNQIFKFKPSNKVFLDKFSKKLCGKFRPGHFEGVLNVINRFLEIIKPKFLFLGKKDFQQLILIKKHIFKNKIPCNVIECNTIRNKHGLAYSSRNEKLTKKDLLLASKAINFLRKQKKNLKFNKNKIYFNKITDYLREIGIKRVDYIELLNTKNFSKHINSNKKFNIFIAFYINKIRLIDNF